MQKKSHLAEETDQLEDWLELFAKISTPMGLIRGIAIRLLKLSITRACFAAGVSETLVQKKDDLLVQIDHNSTQNGKCDCTDDQLKICFTTD